MTIGRRIVALMMAAMLAAGAITGCGREAASSQAAEENASSLSQQQGQEPAEEDGPLVLTDQAGRTVTLEEPAQRIVSAYYLSSSLLIALGAEDRVVGIEMKADTREIYKRAAPQFLELPAVGSGKGINVEETAALEPDLVILPIKLQESAQQFDALGIPCLVIDPETLDGFLETIRLVGEATGTSQRAADLAAYHQQVMEDVGARTAACDTRPTVYIGGSDFLSTAGSGMYQDELIAIAGGTNVAGERPVDRHLRRAADRLESREDLHGLLCRVQPGRDPGGQPVCLPAGDGQRRPLFSGVSQRDRAVGLSHPLQRPGHFVAGGPSPSRRGVGGGICPGGR